MANRPLVCLLREPISPDPYEQALEAAGFRSVLVPVLRFQFVNQDALLAALAEPKAFAGLICTSPRSVAALAQAWEQGAVNRTAWQKKPVFVVGPRTAEAVRDLDLTPVGEEAGNAETLAEQISQQSFGASLLFLSGNRRRDVLPEGLAVSGVSFRELVVYKTHLCTDLMLDTLSLDGLVFFSPSGVEAVQQSGFNARLIRNVAIGPTTAEAVVAAGWSVAAVAAEPTPSALVAACRDAL